MKILILRNWNFMRFVRLGLGITIIVQSVIVKDFSMGLLGVLFTGMPIFNVGCCSSGRCAAPIKKKLEQTKEITYEEMV